jgi:hypothetical protein
MTIPIRAALYLRVSTGRQADNDLSIPQRRQAKGYCTSRGWEIVADYVEPGVSATDDRRPEFQRMIDAATTKPPRSTAPLPAGRTSAPPRQQLPRRLAQHRRGQRQHPRCLERPTWLALAHKPWRRRSRPT